MRLPDAISKVLAGRSEPLLGHEVAQVADVAYKAAIDALGRMHDAGTVVRFGRKRGAAWALVGSPAACQADPMGALESLWRKQGSISPPHPPRGGGQDRTPT
jgi:hypothetical protein